MGLSKKDRLHTTQKMRAFYSGLLNNYLERIIIGQQLSIFLGSDNDGIEIFNTILNIFESKLKALNGQIKDFYLDKNSLKSDFIVLSKLRKSPLVGLGSTILK